MSVLFTDESWPLAQGLAWYRSSYVLNKQMNKRMGKTDRTGKEREGKRREGKERKTLQRKEKEQDEFRKQFGCSLESKMLELQII